MSYCSVSANLPFYRYNTRYNVHAVLFYSALPFTYL